MSHLLLICIGGVIGALMRFQLGRVAFLQWSSTFPLPTFIINMTGSLGLGFLYTAVAHHPQWNNLEYFFGIGFFGSFTTFSTFGFEAVSLFDRGFWGRALLYVVFSAYTGVLAAWIGVRAAHAFGVA